MPRLTTPMSDATLIDDAVVNLPLERLAIPWQLTIPAVDHSLVNARVSPLVQRTAFAEQPPLRTKHAGWKKFLGQDV